MKLDESSRDFLCLHGSNFTVCCYTLSRPALGRVKGTLMETLAQTTEHKEPAKQGTIGRPTQFTPEKRTAILEAVRLGLPEGRAAELCGLDPSTLAHWKARGREEDAGPYYDFLMDLKEADAHCERALLSVVRKAAESERHWTAAMTLLERKWPKRWGRMDRVTAGGLSAEDLLERRLANDAAEISYQEIEAKRVREQKRATERKRILESPNFTEPLKRQLVAQLDAESC